MNNLYHTLRDQSNRYGETNDCTVVALAIVTQVNYELAHAEMKSRGRKKGRGANSTQYLPSIEALGSHYVDVTGLFEGKTVKTLGQEMAKRFPGKRFLISVSGHLLAFDGEQIADWTKNRRHRVRCIRHVARLGEELLPEMKSKPKARYEGHLEDIVFWWHHPEKTDKYGREQYRIYRREGGKVRWTNTVYDEWDANEATWRSSRNNWLRDCGELNPAEVETD